MKAADLDDREFLERIAAHNALSEVVWTYTWDLAQWYPDVPFKIALAKASKLVRRGMLDGCTCGCRGDFTLTAKGTAFLADLAPKDGDCGD